MKSDAWKPILAVLLLIAAFSKTTPNPKTPTTDDKKPPVVVVEEKPTNPFPSETLAVLVVYDDGAVLPASQDNILTGVKLRKRLKELGAEARFWDQTETGEHDLPKFQAAMKVPREKLPWIYIAHGKRGTSEALPMTEAETISLVDKFK